MVQADRGACAIRYAYGIVVGPTGTLSGNPIYDFFMGSILNPRVGVVDIKMVGRGTFSHPE